MSAIVASGLGRRFGDFEAVRGVDLDIAAGRCFAMLGPNGAGKTTLTRMIQAVLPRSEGELEVLGLDPDREGPALRTRIGIVPQGDNLDPDLNCLDNLKIYGRFFGQSHKLARKNADRLLEFAQLTDRAKLRPNTLSGGMRRRLMIARAMVNEPELLLLDEPTTALDPQARHTVWGWLQQLKGQGLTMLLTTHDMEEAERMSDRLMVIDHGKKLVEGRPDALIAERVGEATIELQRVTLDEVGELCAGANHVEAAGRSVFAHFADGDEARKVHRDALEQGRTAVLRQASLEDLFMCLTGRGLRQ